jgi:DNA-3-methyladenine glycosylase
LPREFFARPADQVAPDLLGCVIAHETAAGLVAAVLVEVEAYTGESDPASHAFRGRTARNAVMYGPPGYAYVYFTYGMHFCVNLVCQPEGDASAVLLRAGRVIDGVALARARRSGPKSRPEQADGGTVRPGTVPSRGVAPDPDGPDPDGPEPPPRAVPRDSDLARGPARLCQALDIDRSQNGADVAGPDAALRVFAPPVPVPAASISRGPRVGVSRAADVRWRFWVAGDPAVSPYRPYVARRSGVNRLPVPGLEVGRFLSDRHHRRPELARPDRAVHGPGRPAQGP